MAQLYVSAPESEAIRPVRELKGFEKTELAPGEEKEVSFTLDKRAFAWWNTEIGDWYAETGTYRIEIGSSSRDILLSEDVKVLSTTVLPRHYDMNTIFMDLMKDPRALSELKPFLQRERPEEKQENQTETAKDAISDEMGAAMAKYMPLRGMLSFGGEHIPPETIQALEAKLRELSD